MCHLWGEKGFGKVVTKRTMNADGNRHRDHPERPCYSQLDSGGVSQSYPEGRENCLKGMNLQFLERKPLAKHTSVLGRKRWSMWPKSLESGKGKAVILSEIKLELHSVHSPLPEMENTPAAVI